MQTVQSGVMRAPRTSVVAPPGSAVQAWQFQPSSRAAAPARQVQQPPPEPKERWAAPRRNPESSLPSAWTQSFSMNPDDVLGGGAFAKIFRVKEKATGKSFAVKVMNRPNFTLRGIGAQIEAEIEAMRRCAGNRYGRHVAQLCDFAEESEHVYLRMEMCSCDLLRYTGSQPNNVLKESEAMNWMRQLLLGLRDLHHVGVLHRDLKPENLLLTSEGVLKIADFGWCTDLRENPRALAGTFLYMAPEVLAQRSVQTEAVDVWSAGVTFFQLLTGRQLLNTYLGPGASGLSQCDPHEAIKVKTGRLVQEIFETCPPSDDQRPESLSMVSWNLIRRLLEPEVRRRATVVEALGHAWLHEAPTSSDSIPAAGAVISPRKSVVSQKMASSVVMKVPTPMRNRLRSGARHSEVHFSNVDEEYTSQDLSVTISRRARRASIAGEEAHREFEIQSEARPFAVHPRTRSSAVFEEMPISPRGGSFHISVARPEKMTTQELTAIYRAGLQQQTMARTMPVMQAQMAPAPQMIRLAAPAVHAVPQMRTSPRPVMATMMAAHPQVTMMSHQMAMPHQFGPMPLMQTARSTTFAAFRA